MNLRTIEDLNASITRNVHRIRRDIDIIVGIPRSGLLPATLLSLYLNRPMTDVQGLVEKRLIRAGAYRRPPALFGDTGEPRTVLLIDDSVNTGKQMRSAVAEIQRCGIPHEIITAAVYVSRRSRDAVDVYFDVCPMPRVFEWNVMQHSRMPAFCVDMDGVLCLDPTREQNDDGPAYLRFIREVSPRFVPTQRIGYIVTCRLEKYRRLTEEWLATHGFQYGALIMMDLPDKEARVRSGSHGRFKADVYRGTDTELFIESSAAQAQEIARLSSKPVLCIEGPAMVLPPAISRAAGVASAVSKRPITTLQRAARPVYRRVRHALRKVFADHTGVR